MLAAAAARKKAGQSGKVYLLDKNPQAVAEAKKLPFVTTAEAVDATDPRQVMKVIHELTQGRMADLVINCANVAGTEAASVMIAKPTGTVLFFNMATRFQSAVLAAEGIGHETRLVMGNGYYPGHVEIALNLVRESHELRNWFEKKFGGC